MKKPYALIALALAGILTLPLAGQALFKSDSSADALSRLAPSAGPEVPDPAPAAASNVIPAEASAGAMPPSQNSLGLSTAGTVIDTEEMPPLRITPDKPEVITLDRDAINILVGSNKHLRVVPDTNRTLVLIPKQPGSTYFKALDAEGKVIMQRYVIIGSPKSNYIRVRRACSNSDKNCQQYSVYYCPDMCHDVSVVQGDANRGSPSVPQDAPLYRPRENGEDKGSPEQTGEPEGATDDMLEEPQ